MTMLASTIHQATGLLDGTKQQTHFTNAYSRTRHIWSISQFSLHSGELNPIQQSVWPRIAMYMPTLATCIQCSRSALNLDLTDSRLQPSTSEL
jgi:hypothetical protein